jgi:hypothetical protein
MLDDLSVTMRRELATFLHKDLLRVSQSAHFRPPALGTLALAPSHFALWRGCSRARCSLG